MKKVFLLLSLNLIFCFSYAQLKANNFLFLDSINNEFIANTVDNRIRVFILKNTNFSYEKDLTFYHYIKTENTECCNYYEVKSILKEWNIITLSDLINYLEDKTQGFSFYEKKLFFVEFDKERKIYKAWQVYIIGWPRED